MKFIFERNKVSNAETGFDIPDSEHIQLQVSGNDFTNVRKLLHVRSNEMPASLKQLIELVQQHGGNPEDIPALIEAIAGAGKSQTAQEEAVKKSPIWATIRETAPEFIAIAIKTAMELVK